MAKVDIYESPILNLPSEVQEYVDDSEIDGTVLDVQSFSAGMPDGEISSVSYTVTWLDGVSTVKTKIFFYDFTAEGEVFKAASDEASTDSCSVLRWASRLIEKKELGDYWKIINKSEGVA